jgi:hypothetical protein
MVSAYRDRAGTYHVFSDVLNHDRRPSYDVLASWDGRIDRYRSRDLKDFTYVEAVVARSEARDTPDSIGAASPGVAVAGGHVLLFYAGRGPGDPERPPDLNALRGRIMLASAPADDDGAPAGPFVKRGVLVDLVGPWGSLRLDDPCACVLGDDLLLYFKAIGAGAPMGNRVVMRARGRVDDPFGPYAVDPEPVLRVEGGGEMPRVFVRGGGLHMFYRRFRPPASTWEHYASGDGIVWSLVNDRLFGCAGPNPGKRVTDICPIWTPFGAEPFDSVFAAGLDDGSFGDEGRIKQWLYEVAVIAAGDA